MKNYPTHDSLYKWEYVITQDTYCVMWAKKHWTLVLYLLNTQPKYRDLYYSTLACVMLEMDGLLLSHGLILILPEIAFSFDKQTINH